MARITIKNTSRGSVGLIVPEMRLNRNIKPNDFIYLDSEVFEEALTYPGVRELIDEGDVAIVEEDARLELGIQVEENSIKEEDIANLNEIKDILTTGSPFAIKKMCQNAPTSKKETIARAALECDLTLEKMDILTKETGIDILSAIKSFKELQEPSKE